MTSPRICGGAVTRPAYPSDTPIRGEIRPARRAKAKMLWVKRAASLFDIACMREGMRGRRSWVGDGRFIGPVVACFGSGVLGLVVLSNSEGLCLVRGFVTRAFGSNGIPILGVLSWSGWSWSAGLSWFGVERSKGQLESLILAQNERWRQA